MHSISLLCPICLKKKKRKKRLRRTTFRPELMKIFPVIVLTTICARGLPRRLSTLNWISPDIGLPNYWPLVNHDTTTWRPGDRVLFFPPRYLWLRVSRRWNPPQICKNVRVTRSACSAALPHPSFSSTTNKNVKHAN